MELNGMRDKVFLLLVVSVGAVFFAGSVRGQEREPVPASSPGISGLIGKLQSSDPAQRVRAKNALLRLGGECAPIVLKALPSAKPEAAYEMIMILTTIDYAESAGLIEEIWEKSADNKVKLAAALALCRFDRNFPKYQGYLVDRAKKGEEADRLEAMQMLGYVKNARVVPVLKEIFYDDTQPDQIRQAAVWDLAHTPYPESARVLVEMVNDPNVDWFYKEVIITSLRLLAAEEGMASVISGLLEKSQGLPSRDRKATPAPEE